MLASHDNRKAMRAVGKVAAMTALVVAVMAVVIVGAAMPAHAQDDSTDGLNVSSTTIFMPNVDAQNIAVTSSYTMTNINPDEVVGDSVRSFFYTSWTIALPENVVDLRAVGADRDLSIRIDDAPESEGIVFAEITLPFNLNFEQTVTVDVDYTMPGSDPRVEGVVARVNDSFLSFSVWATGDSAQTDVQIYVPTGFEIEVQGDLAGLERTVRDGQTVYEAIAIEEPRKFFGTVFGRNDAGLLIDTATLPDGGTATVRAWPDDPAWAEFVVNAIEDDVPVIEDLTGLDWPGGDIEVIETVTPYLYGYAGWFNADSGIIEVGEQLERDLILHELAHAWFNDDLIGGRWITEGLAEEIASRTIAATDDVRPDPARPDLSDPVRVQLANWASPWELAQEDAYAYEQYHYNASWWVIRQITDDVGLDAFADVLVALDADEMAFAGEGPIEETFLSTRWWHFFDLLDRRAGAENLDELFRTYVLSDEDAAKLAPRRETHDAYDRFISQSGEWGSPLVVRNQLSAWKFALANDRIRQATEVLLLRNRSEELARELGVTFDHDGERLYEAAETSDDLEDAKAEVQRQLDLMDDLVDNRATVLLRADALDVTVDHQAESLTEALATVATQRQHLNELEQGRTRVEALADRLDLANPAWPQVTSGADLAMAVDLADARFATLDAIQLASARATQPRSLMERAGLWRTNIDAPLEQARSAFEADELDQALVAASRSDALLANAGATGKRRLGWIGAIIAAVVITGLITAYLRRKR